MNGKSTIPALFEPSTEVPPEVKKFMEKRDRVVAITNRLFDTSVKLTVNQRINLLACVYWEAVSAMGEFMAVREVCKKAVNSGEWTDREIAEGLWRMGRQKRRLSAQSLMAFLAKSERRSTTDERVQQALDLREWARRRDLEMGTT